MKINQYNHHFITIFFMSLLIIMSGIVIPVPDDSLTSFDTAADSILTKLGDGNTEGSVSFGLGGGVDSSLQLKIPKQSNVLTARFNVSGLAEGSVDYPSNVKIDIGDDGDLEWEYNLSGAGSLGKQTEFVGGVQSKLFRLDTGKFDSSLILRLPRTANVLAANLDVTGYNHGVPNGHFNTSTISGWNVITNQYTDTVAVQSTRDGNNPGAGWGATGDYLMLRSNPYGIASFHQVRLIRCRR